MPPALPCFPCPHGSRCCFHGTAVTEEERAAIAREHGEAALRFEPRDGVWRTALREGRCVFLGDQGCRIHAQAYYPEVCRGYPWRAGLSAAPYEYPVDECPEFARRDDLRPLFDPETGKLRVV